MKVGIVTFHRAENFGATLQAYALQTYLTHQGCDAEIIDYRCPFIERNYDVLNPRILWSRKNALISLKLYMKRFFNLKDRIQKKRNFKTFWARYYHLSSSVSKISRDLGYDLYITGSDQVWNLHLTGGVDKVYFLSFPMKHEAKKISYAASAENDPKGLLWKNKALISGYLKSFDSISVREEFLRADLKRYIENSISVCLDPTFLLNKECYEDIAIMPEDVGKYVLVYHMTSMSESVSLANKIASVRGCRVIEIFGGYSGSKDKERYKSNLGPAEILGYIACADTIVTTSFHGLALSLIMNKDFWIVNHSGNYRQRNLLTQLGLASRMVENHKTCDIDQAIDYSVVNATMSDLVRRSKSFLQEYIAE